MTDLLDQVRDSLPANAMISKLYFEGSEVVAYTKNRDFFVGNEQVIKQIVNRLKKRIQVRPDSEIRLDQTRAEEVIKKIVPEDAGITNLWFEEEYGKVKIEARKPGLVIGKSGYTLNQIRSKTCWLPEVIRTPLIPSRIVDSIRNTEYESRKFKMQFLKKIGEKIHQPGKELKWVRLTSLGGFREVGRSCILLQTPNSNVLLDCGLNIGGKEMFPYLEAPEFDLNKLDAIVLSHAHLDHCLPPNTPVYTSSGIKPIDEVKVGDRLLSINLITGKLTMGKCVRKLKTDSHKEILQIKTPFSFIEASPNHRFFVVKDLKIEEIEAKKLKRGMLIPISSPKVPYRECKLDTSIEYLGVTKKYPDDLVNFYIDKKICQRHRILKFPDRLIGELAQCIWYVIGDGHLSSEYSIRATDESIDCLKNYKKLFRSVFGNGIIRHHSDKSKSAYWLELNAVGIKRFLEKNFDGIYDNNEVMVPDKILYGSEEIRGRFTRGIADTEGTVMSGIVKIGMSSHLILDQLQFILSSLGIPASICYSDNRIMISSKYGLSLFQEKTGFSHPEKKEKLVEEVEPNEPLPITSKDLNKILQNARIIGRDGSPRINDLPSSIVDWYRRNDKSLATRRTVRLLIKELKKRANELKRIKGGDIWKVRQRLSITRKEVGEAVGASMIQVQYREEKKYEDELTEKMRRWLKERLTNTIERIEKDLKKIEHLLQMEVRWEKIEEIKKISNPYPYLVDIEVEPTKNFIANGIVVHNSGAIPLLFRYGYKGPVYCTAPTRDLSTLIQLDYINVTQREAEAVYTSKEIEKMIKHTIPLEYGEVTDITSDIRLTLFDAGHIAGSSIVHLHIGEGLHNLIYSGDLKYGQSRLLNPANTRFPRVETLIIEGTYGNPDDIMPPRRAAESELISTIRETINRGGKVLAPVFSIGRSQELCLVLEDWLSKEKIDAPVYLDGMVWDATAIHTAYIEYLSRNLQNLIFGKGINPFLSKVFHRVGSPQEREQVINGGPCIVLATSGMMSGGPSIEYLKAFAEDPKNTLIFVGYQAVGTLGRKIQTLPEKEIKEIPIGYVGGRIESLEVNMEIKTIEGFSGHSDRMELIKFVQNLSSRPERIIVNHGDRSKCLSLAYALHKLYGIQTEAPKNLETIRLV